jgi:hypothetical protein
MPAERQSSNKRFDIPDALQINMSLHGYYPNSRETDRPISCYFVLPGSLSGELSRLEEPDLQWSRRSPPAMSNSSDFDTIVIGARFRIETTGPSYPCTAKCTCDDSPGMDSSNGEVENPREPFSAGCGSATAVSGAGSKLGVLGGAHVTTRHRVLLSRFKVRPSKEPRQCGRIGPRQAAAHTGGSCDLHTDHGLTHRPHGIPSPYAKSTQVIIVAAEIIIERSQGD